MLITHLLVLASHVAVRRRSLTRASKENATRSRQRPPIALSKSKSETPASSTLLSAYVHWLAVSFLPLERSSASHGKVLSGVLFGMNVDTQTLPLCEASLNVDTQTLPPCKVSLNVDTQTLPLCEAPLKCCERSYPVSSYRPRVSHGKVPS